MRARGVTIFTIALLGLLPSGLTAEAGETSKRKRIAIHVALCDDTHLSGSRIQEIEEESAALFSRGAVHIIWSDGPGSCKERPPASGAPYARVYILDELPASIRALHPARDFRQVMAVTLGNGSNGPGPVVYVSRSAVEAIATLPGGGITRGLSTRALGRVLAHELAHRFLAEPGHAEEGLLKRVLARDDLVFAPRHTLALSPVQTERLRRTVQRTRKRGLAGSEP